MLSVGKFVAPRNEWSSADIYVDNIWTARTPNLSADTQYGTPAYVLVQNKKRVTVGTKLGITRTVYCGNEGSILVVN